MDWKKGSNSFESAGWSEIFVKYAPESTVWSAKRNNWHSDMIFFRSIGKGVMAY